MSETTDRIRCGDIVHHKPSGEDWVVAYADYETGDLAWLGWPDGLARIADCVLKRRVSDESHQGWLAHLATSSDRRAKIALRIYGDPSNG